MRRFGMTGTAVLALALAAGACSNDPSGSNNNGNQGVAQMRLMNTVVGGPSLDLLIGGQVVASGIGFEQSSGLAGIPGGTQTLTLRRSGQTADLVTRQVTIAQGKKYTVSAAGSVAAPSLTSSVVSDTGLARSDRANIRIINIGVDVPTDSSHIPPQVLVDVYFTPPGVSISGASSNMSMDLRYSSYSTLIYFTPGDWVVTFTTAGTKNILASSAGMTIPAGEVRAVTIQKVAAAYVTTVTTEH